MMRWSGAMHFIGRSVTAEVEDRVKSNSTSQDPSPVSQVAPSPMVPGLTYLS